MGCFHKLSEQPRWRHAQTTTDTFFIWMKKSFHIFTGSNINNCFVQHKLVLLYPAASFLNNRKFLSDSVIKVKTCLKVKRMHFSHYFTWCLARYHFFIYIFFCCTVMIYFQAMRPWSKYVKWLSDGNSLMLLFSVGGSTTSPRLWSFAVY